MRALFLMFIVGVVGSCTPQTQDPALNDDYVLIEFASKLEEDADKFKALESTSKNH